MVEAIAECVKVLLPLTPALLLRGLNCIGSASLKGASLAWIQWHDHRFTGQFQASA
jgi:hypothetical protein